MQNISPRSLPVKVDSTWFMLPLVGLLAAFPPIATSMYLPAMPHLQSVWDVELKTINLTLVCFYLSYCSSLLAYGPISDRIGRRPPLMVGIIVFIFGSLLCANAESVFQLITGRIFQGLGAAGPSALGLSIIKDKYAGPNQKRVLAIVGLLISLAPMMGPVLGSWTLKFTNWHFIFIIQVMLAAVAFTGVLKLPETLAKKTKTPYTKMAKPYLILLKNKRFVLLNFSFAASMCPLFAFVATSADIYIVRFGVSQQAYGFYFGMTSMAMMIGASICVKVSENVKDMTMIRLGFGGMCLSGLILWLAPFSGPVSFTLIMFLTILSFGLTRPFSVSMVLNSVDCHIGAASSLMMFANFAMGAFSAWFISLGWPDSINVLGMMSLFSGAFILFMVNRISG